MTRLVAEPRVPAPATFADLLNVIGEAGTHAAIQLNRAHFLLAKSEAHTFGEIFAAPSDRWYRLYAQLESRALSRDANGDDDPRSPQAFALTAGLLFNEASDLERRAALLPRQEIRASVRDQVAEAVRVVRNIASLLLNRAVAGDDGRSTHGRPFSTVTETALESVVAAPQERETGDDLDALVGAAVDGDRAAVDSVLRWIRPLVLRYCRARVGSQEKTFASADDVVQEVCLAVFAALPSYRDKGRPFLAFVYGIAAQKVADAHRSAARNRAEPVLEIPDSPELADAGPEQLAMQGELAGRMYKLLDMLPGRQREILVLRVVMGLSVEETAKAVGAAPGSVRVIQHRALGRLRSVLASEVVL